MIPFLPMKPNLFSGRARLVGALVVVAMISPSLSAGAAGPRVRQVSARSAVEPSAVDALRPAERAFLMQAVEDTRQQLRLAHVAGSPHPAQRRDRWCAGWWYVRELSEAGGDHWQ